MLAKSRVSALQVREAKAIAEETKGKLAAIQERRKRRQEEREAELTRSAADLTHGELKPLRERLAEIDALLDLDMEKQEQLERQARADHLAYEQAREAAYADAVARRRAQSIVVAKLQERLGSTALKIFRDELLPLWSEMDTDRIHLEEVLHLFTGGIRGEEYTRRKDAERLIGEPLNGKRSKSAQVGETMLSYLRDILDEKGEPRRVIIKH